MQFTAGWGTLTKTLHKRQMPLRYKVITKVLGVVELDGVALPSIAFLFLLADLDRVSKRLATSAGDGGFTGVSLTLTALGVLLGLRVLALLLMLVVVNTPRMIPRGVASSICLDAKYTSDLYRTLKSIEK